MNKFTFFDLRVYQESKALVKEVYKLLKKFPKFEVYALGDQLRRAVISVPSNIAEGSGRFSIKEKIHFIEIAYGSLMEAYNQLLIAVDLTYIDTDSVMAIKPTIDNVAKMLNGLRNSFTRKLLSQ